MYSKVHDSARKLDDWAQSKLIVEKVEGVHPNQTCFRGRKNKTTREKLRNTFRNSIFEMTEIISSGKINFSLKALEDCVELST